LLPRAGSFFRFPNGQLCGCKARKWVTEGRGGMPEITEENLHPHSPCTLLRELRGLRVKIRAVAPPRCS
jgi:hypothetical protein